MFQTVTLFSNRNLFCSQADTVPWSLQALTVAIATLYWCPAQAQLTHESMCCMWRTREDSPSMLSRSLFMVNSILVSYTNILGGNPSISVRLLFDQSRTPYVRTYESVRQSIFGTFSLG